MINIEQLAVSQTSRLYLHHGQDTLVGGRIRTDDKVAFGVVGNGVFGLPVSCSAVVSVCHIHTTDLVVPLVFHCYHSVLHTPEKERKKNKDEHQ